MTALAELERMASRVVAPGSSSDVVAIVDVEPGGRLQSGGPSGVVVEADGTKRAPRTRYGAAWFDGLVKSPIQWFDRASDAYTFIRILKGEPSSSRRETPAAAVASIHPGGNGGATPRPTDVPPASASEPGTCPECGGPMPPAGHGQRRLTCSDRCRTARRRALRGAPTEAEASGASAPRVTASRAPAPTSRPAGHFVAAPSRSGSAERPADLEAGQTELGF